MSMNNYIALSAVLFSIGAVGVLTRRNAIVAFMSVEMMLNAANLAFVAFAALLGAMVVVKSGVLVGLGRLDRKSVV